MTLFAVPLSRPPTHASTATFSVAVLSLFPLCSNFIPATYPLKKRSSFFCPQKPGQRNQRKKCLFIFSLLCKINLEENSIFFVCFFLCIFSKPEQLHSKRWNSICVDVPEPRTLVIFLHLFYFKNKEMTISF
jgi:hypothetical protein